MEENEILLVFTFSNVKRTGLSEGHIKYVLWESENTDVRYEQVFVFGTKDIVKY